MASISWWFIPLRNINAWLLFSIVCKILLRTGLNALKMFLWALIGILSSLNSVTSVKLSAEVIISFITFLWKSVCIGQVNLNFLFCIFLGFYKSLFNNVSCELRVIWHKEILLKWKYLCRYSNCISIQCQLQPRFSQNPLKILSLTVDFKWIWIFMCEEEARKGEPRAAKHIKLVFLN